MFTVSGRTNWLCQGEHVDCVRDNMLTVSERTSWLCQGESDRPSVSEQVDSVSENKSTVSGRTSGCVRENMFLVSS